ncbi:MAG: efflux RND transporter permease subunit [bacterium]
MVNKIIRFCLENILIVVLITVFLILWGVMVAPFDWDIQLIPRDPVPVDAIPDIGENQQIVFTEWEGRSPQDVEDQITYPLTVSLLGIPGVQTIRSYSMFGFSSVYIIFQEDVEFYWSRSRVLEKLNSLPPDALPEGVRPSLGPDATGLGQVFWYTLEGYDSNGNPTGGWDLDELRTIQDWYVRYALQSVEGISEVASIGGFVREYQIDVDPDAMRAHGITLTEVFNAVRNSNVDVGARTIEINSVDYVIRGLGFIKSLEDIEKTVVKVNDHVPLTVKDVAHVSYGPALRTGALDKAGAEAVGGVVVVRYGDNPLAAINRIKDKIEEISPGLPKKTLDDGTVSQVKIIPFYDRSGLIYETLGTLDAAIVEEIMVTVIVIIVMVFHLGSSLLIASLLPLAVLMTFIAMKIFHVDANIVALSGIAIAIGTIVDMGIVICENILKHLETANEKESKLEVIYRASTEVGSAVLTAVSTTVISFLPVFTMEAAEGKLFKPLAYTKTFALIASIIVALTIIPPFAYLLFTKRIHSQIMKKLVYGGLIVAGLVMMSFTFWWLGVILILFGIYPFVQSWIPTQFRSLIPYLVNGLAVFIVTIMLSNHWLPLGPGRGELYNWLFVVLLIGGILSFFHLFMQVYPSLLRWCLENKLLFLSLPLIITLLGATIWLGFEKVFWFVPQSILRQPVVSDVRHAFPGIGKEFMPSLDEGSFLYMPTTMPHASLGEALDMLQQMDMAINAIPEVELVVGKIGRAESPLDPAPISMFETVINYKSEYLTDASGNRLRFRVDPRSGEFLRDEQGNLISDPDGMPYRQWREHIHSPDDIWEEIVKTAQMPGITSAPKLQPIETRIVMLQTGMRAPMGVKIKGPDLETIEETGLQIEKFLKEVPSVMAEAVIADRIIGVPYLEIEIHRDAIARYGISIRDVQDVIEVAIGGMGITTTVEGRERYPVRVRYMRELRDSIESLSRILVPTPMGAQIPLKELAEIQYVQGPQMIKSEDTFLLGYVLFDKQPDFAEVDVVEQARDYLKMKEASGELVIPAGVSYTFAGSYENQVRSEKKLRVVLPLALFLIFMIIYFEFRKVPVTLIIFSGILVAWSGGFIMLWLYSQEWFLNFSLFGVNLRETFQVHPYNLSVAVWVGFLALFGVTTDDGVLQSTYMEQTMAKRKPCTIQEIREAIIYAGTRRIRPCLMTTSTTILALIPVLTSTGRGSDIMVPMAIPSFGGMMIELISVFVVPVLYCALQEWKLKREFKL